ncbi:CobB/CobQ-like glutamine amidotransferase domain protein [Verrucomicrobiia bacterium DG1235]|nr:CobB/CobQ-like glutamine amidotransferase domain protein [Verrucomicrobiae bacterium DG1235]
MANNAFATLEGGEIGVAQAVQAEACGLRPRVEMNPILLKPNGPDGSQIVRLGKAGETVRARDYYDTIEESWRIVRETLDGWRSECDVLVMEGAGSPVELNLMDRDIVNLRPIEHVDGRWLLVSNIEYGGVFAQVVGTWSLLPEAMRGRGLGFLVNRFRGDLGLFDGARREFEGRLSLPYLGVMPFGERLRIDDEDSLNAEESYPSSGSAYIAWVKYPQVSNTPDQQAWDYDEGVESVWTRSAKVLSGAAAIVLPGSKNTLSDLAWLKRTGLNEPILAAAARGVPVVGICGGKQMLGERLFELDSGSQNEGLGLLPIETEYCSDKQVQRNEARFEGEVWECFEIHVGRTRVLEKEGMEALLETRSYGAGEYGEEGHRLGSIWGSYQHGLFDSPQMRRRLLEAAGVAGGRVSNRVWRADRSGTYDAMATHLESYLDLDGVKRYLGL